LRKFNILGNVTQGWEGDINMALQEKIDWGQQVGFVWLRARASDELM
jgi:hypothetical protein